METVLNKKTLPDDVETLQDLLLKKVNIIHKKENIILGKESFISELKKTNEILLEKIKLLEKYRYGRSSEKLTEEDKVQLALFNEAEASVGNIEIEAEQLVVPSYSRNKKNRRKALPEDLPRKLIVHELSESERQCQKIDCPKYNECQKMRPVIGTEETEELEFIPATIEVNHHIRYNYGSIKCNLLESGETMPSVVSADKEKRLIPGSIATPSLLSYVAVSKFADALPFYRQERLFKRIGIEISRQTMSNWMIKASSGMEAFVALLGEWVLMSPLLNIDETTVQVLNEIGKSVQSKSYMWVRVGNKEDKKVVLFNYYRDRKKERVEDLTKGYKGAIQTDGYAGYNKVGARSEIWHVGCWAHARRKFHDAYKGSKKGKIAVKGLEYIRKLYTIEKRLRKENLSAKEFVERRRKGVIPILKKFRKWLKTQSEIVAPESLAGKAISYTLNEYVRLVRYLKYDFISPDNNAAERAIRPFVIGRRNWLFQNTPLGAYASSTMYSLIETAKANNLEPYRYLELLFRKIPGTETKEDLEKLLPWNVTGIPPLKMEKKDGSS